MNMNPNSKRKIRNAALAVTRWVGSPLSLFFHSVFFSGIFILGFSGAVDPTFVFAITTNILSIEAIYLAIFIQMTINYQAQALEEVQEDVGEIQEDVQEMQEDVGEIQEDVEEMQEDVGEIQTDMDEVQKDVDELQEDVQEITEEEKAEEVAEERRKTEQRETLESIESSIQKLLSDIEHLKQTRKDNGAKPMF